MSSHLPLRASCGSISLGGMDFSCFAKASTRELETEEERRDSIFVDSDNDSAAAFSAAEEGMKGDVVWRVEVFGIEPRRVAPWKKRPAADVVEDGTLSLLVGDMEGGTRGNGCGICG